MPGIPDNLTDRKVVQLFARPEVREAFESLIPGRTLDRQLIRAQIACMNVHLTVDEIEMIDAVLPTIDRPVLWPTDGVRCCDPDVLMAVAEHLVAKFRAAAEGARKPVCEDDLNALFAAIDPDMNDAARQVMTGQAVRFRAERLAREAEVQVAPAVFHDSLGLMPTVSEDVPAVRS